MANPVINGHVYKNIDYIKLQNDDGKIRVFYDSAQKDHRQPDASLSAKNGLKFAILVSANLPTSTASLRKESA